MLRRPRPGRYLGRDKSRVQPLLSEPAILEDATVPAVSVILPTYNRASFLSQAFASIQAQSLNDWELIVVDDGSTDGTEAMVRELLRPLGARGVLVSQPNRGAYGARNRGLEVATGRYVALFDSDDVWLPDYLSTCVNLLDAHPDVDWVYAACRVVDFASGRVLDPDTFAVGEDPRPFRRLNAERRAHLSVIRDSAAVSCALQYGLYCGLQNSVIRRSVFEGSRFHDAYRNEAEDQLFVIRTLKRGHRLGYVDRVLVQYHVHDANSSGSSTAPTFDRQRQLLELLIRGFEDLAREVELTAYERRVLARRLGREYFWHLGYAVFLENGRDVEARRAFRSGLWHWPWNWRCWKTFLASEVRAIVGRPNRPGTN